MKAIVLVSGGLDSALAGRLIKELGIEVIPLYFKIPFCHRLKTNGSLDKRETFQLSANLDAAVRTIDIGDDFLNLLVKPKHGFGSNMNPCIDCKILMLRKTKGLMQEWGAAFVVTGEVLGQRPMSQHRQALLEIEKESGLNGLLLRPLSARLLPETIPEKEGWIDRAKLLNFSGRSRKPQIELAENFEFKNYPNAAGGCLLTEPGFSRRLKDVMQFDRLSNENIELIKLGRYFKISDNARLIVGRDEPENNTLIGLARENDYLFMPTDELAGPIALGRGAFNDELVKLCCSITCRYCDIADRLETGIVYKKVPGEEKILIAKPMRESEVISLRI